MTLNELRIGGDEWNIIKEIREDVGAGYFIDDVPEPLLWVIWQIVGYREVFL